MDKYKTGNPAILMEIDILEGAAGAGDAYNLAIVQELARLQEELAKAKAEGESLKSSVEYRYGAAIQHMAAELPVNWVAQIEIEHEGYSFDLIDPAGSSHADSFCDGLLEDMESSVDFANQLEKGNDG